MLSWAYMQGNGPAQCNALLIKSGRRHSRADVEPRGDRHVGEGQYRHGGGQERVVLVEAAEVNPLHGLDIAGHKIHRDLHAHLEREDEEVVQLLSGFGPRDRDRDELVLWVITEEEHDGVRAAHGHVLCVHIRVDLGSVYHDVSLSCFQLRDRSGFDAWTVKALEPIGTARQRAAYAPPPDTTPILSGLINTDIRGDISANPPWNCSELLAFAIGSMALELTLQEAAKRHLLATKEPLPRRTMIVLISTPTILADTQVRMLLMRLQNVTISVLGSALLAFAEIQCVQPTASAVVDSASTRVSVKPAVLAVRSHVEPGSCATFPEASTVAASADSDSADIAVAVDAQAVLPEPPRALGFWSLSRLNQAAQRPRLVQHYRLTDRSTRR
ncbi:hypothetical protein ON010_g3528 [Phytophthora cinnamomi]|nr:hypothetical protein ON010_g3528 [Phytophthora cinnamomi]